MVTAPARHPPLCRRRQAGGRPRQCRGRRSHPTRPRPCDTLARSHARTLARTHARTNTPLFAHASTRTRAHRGFAEGDVGRLQPRRQPQVSLPLRIQLRLQLRRAHSSHSAHSQLRLLCARCGPASWDMWVGMGKTSVFGGRGAGAEAKLLARGSSATMVDGPQPCTTRHTQHGREWRASTRPIQITASDRATPH